MIRSGQSHIISIEVYSPYRTKEFSISVYMGELFNLPSYQIPQIAYIIMKDLQNNGDIYEKISVMHSNILECRSNKDTELEGVRKVVDKLQELIRALVQKDYDEMGFREGNVYQLSEVKRVLDKREEALGVIELKIEKLCKNGKLKIGILSKSYHHKISGYWEKDQLKKYLSKNFEKV